MLWYLALRAADLFYSKYARWPGALDSALAGDQEEVFQILRRLCLETYQLDASLLDSAEAPDNSDVKMSDGDAPMDASEPGQTILVRRAHAQEMQAIDEARKASLSEAAEPIAPVHQTWSVTDESRDQLG